MQTESLFNSFWIAGLECSTHILKSGKRLDLLQSTGHDQFYEADFRRMREHGFRTLRVGLRWHRIETVSNTYDYSSVLPMLRCAEKQGIQIIWDLFHYGWPDDIDLTKPEFVRRFGRFAKMFAHVLREETANPHPVICPVNEISYFSWAAGDEGIMFPFLEGRGFELKTQLVRASIEGIEAIWDEIPGARILHVDPAIHIIADPERPEEAPIAEGYRRAQFQGWDLLSGRLWPQLGGDPKYLDVIGLNYYPYNQWVYKGPSILMDEPEYRPFRDIIRDVYERYQRPMMISETGAEDEWRGPWLRYVAQETAAAIRVGMPLQGICLYPILNHPGWEDDRHCCNGLWDYADEKGEREIYEPLAEEVRRMNEVIREAQREVQEQGVVVAQ